MSAPTQLDAAGLRAIAEASALDGCSECHALASSGWESMPDSFSEKKLTCVGTLRSSDPDVEPTLDEFHPDGTRYWSANAPISPRHFPYNLCDVWACRNCGRAFLRYTEYGGYYVQQRVRMLDPALVADPDLPTVR